MKAVTRGTWTVLEETPTLLRLEAKKKPSTSGILAIATGILLFLFFLLTLPSTLSGSIAAKNQQESFYFVGLLSVFFIYIGFHLRKVREVKLLIDKSTKALRLEKLMRKNKHWVAEVAIATVVEVQMVRQLSGNKIQIIHTSGMPLDITPLNNSQIKSMVSTAKLVASFLEVEFESVL